jgi:glycosyltransferase involved in cell wall biosynthesis
LLGIPDYVDRVYVVNDGSKDGTEERVKSIASIDNRIVLINHKTNVGVGAAIVTGYSRSALDNMEITAIMAGDNQMAPQELHKLLDPIVEGKADYAKGNRLGSRDTAIGMSDWRFFGNMILTILTRFVANNRQINDPQNGYTAISNQVFGTMKPQSIYTWYGYCNDILVKLSTYGFTIKDVDIPARYGTEKSKITYPKYMFKISRLLFNEFCWRLNYYHNENTTRKADGAIAIGAIISTLGALIPLTYFFSHSSNMGAMESLLGDMIIVILVGGVISYIGFKIKHGDKLGIDDNDLNDL